MYTQYILLDFNIHCIVYTLYSNRFILKVLSAYYINIGMYK